ncbi:MAG: class I SAM-dependent methyltransferase [Pelotomaculum sp.]
MLKGTKQMNNLNISTWEQVYSVGRSLLIWPDENVVSSLKRNQSKLKKGIDIACGAGRHTLLMAQMGINSIGIDSSLASIKFAKQRAAELNLQNVQFINGKAQDLDYPSGDFDVAIVWGLIHYLEKEDQLRVLNTVKRILKSGGLLLCTLRSTDDSKMGNGKLVGTNQYIVDYFDSGTKQAKQTVMYFWDEIAVRETLKGFSTLRLGHRNLKPINLLDTTISHWLIEAIK